MDTTHPHTPRLEKIAELSASARQELLKAASDELAALQHALREDVYPADQGTPTTILAVTRLIPCCSLEMWMREAQKRGFSQWLAYPLESPAGTHLLRLQEALDQLSWQSEHDPLTGLANRRAFDRLLQLEFQRAASSGTSLSVVMLDVDDFKDINDTYGHPCGDNVLVQIAHVLTSGKRPYDIAARIGGEEFALILPGASDVTARLMVERLLTFLRQINISCKEHPPFKVTFSAGVAACKNNGTCKVEELLAQADEALYEAKRTGKSRVLIATSPAELLYDKSTMVQSQEKQVLFAGNNQ